MPISRRSTTGCASCKARRRKCDESKPQCLQCQATGRSCVYEYVQYPAEESHRKRRTKPGPRSSTRDLFKTSQNVQESLRDTDSASCSAPEDSGDSIVPVHSTPLETSNTEIHHGSSLIASQDAFGSHTSAYLYPIPSLVCDSNPTSSGFPLPDRIRPTGGLAPMISGSKFKETAIPEEDELDSESEEWVGLYKAPKMDKNVKENTLPFVLHCYSQWTIVRVFESQKVVYAMREQVITQFLSEKTRTRSILIANVMDMFARDLVIDDTRKSILDRLVLDVQQKGSRFMATSPAPVSGLDRQSAMIIMDSMLEIFSLQSCTRSIACCFQILDYAAPVFRRACSEPPGQPLDLSSLLLGPNSNLRHFVYLDIMMSISTGRPVYFQYEVPFSLELCERMYNWQLRGNCGLQWLHGFPDQYFLFFAWINALCQTPGASDNLGLVTWIETNLPRIKVDIDESGGSLLRIRRMMAQECWRFAVFIYLYMVLCRASAYDPRVIRAQRGFMRLLRGVKPARYPDAYLLTTLVVAGVATTEARDRETLRQRILNIRENTERRTVGNDAMLMLEDIWARTRDEGRPAYCDWAHRQMKMSKFRRSTTGCTFCKARRKKCDETKPQCLRCQSLGKTCSYDFVNYPESEGHRIQRTRPAPRTSSGLLAKVARNAPSQPTVGLPKTDLASTSKSPISEEASTPASSSTCPLETWSDDSQTSPITIAPNYPDFQQDNPLLLPQQDVQSPLTPPYSLYDRRSSVDYPPEAVLTAGRADCLDSLFSLALPNDPLGQTSWAPQNPGLIQAPPDLEPDLGLVHQGAVGALSLPTVFPVPSHIPYDINSTDISLIPPDMVLLPDGTIPQISGPIPQIVPILEEEDEDEDDNDPEKIRYILCTALTADKNIIDNTLPFVLQSYSQWAVARFFEPLKIVDALREQVISQFSSEKSRNRTILIANVMDMFAKKLTIDSKRKSVLDHLASDVKQDGSLVATTSLVEPEQSRQLALSTLDSVLEIFALQACTQSIAAVIRLLEYAAPVFRRACSEPPGQPLNLPNLLLEPNNTFRHFAYMDIIASVTTGRDTYFEYDVPLSLELCEQMYHWERQGNCGLQWLNGFSGQFILLFAWINTLSKIPGAGDNPQLISWIEKQLPLIRVTIDEMGDPLLRIGRLVVQECWRFAVQIYLYLVLCKANAYDPRVVSAQKGFMRLVRGVRRARNPDAYLLNLIAIAGVATIEERDRNTLRQRILNVHEYAEKGTVGNEVVLMLEDVWDRTRDEGRPAVWNDLRIACLRVTGV